jgi:hypothetical protein
MMLDMAERGPRPKIPDHTQFSRRINLTGH